VFFKQLLTSSGSVFKILLTCCDDTVQKLIF